MFQAKDVLDKLDSDQYRSAIKYSHWNRLADDKHGNTLLHLAIVYGKNQAAIWLIMQGLIHGHYNHLFLTDLHQSSKSTPLILAAKTANNQVANLLIGTCKNVSQLDYSDYLGNTALHYACLTRNNDLIEALITSGADANIRNALGYLPIEYYHLDVGVSDLRYRYGVYSDENNLMRHACDWDQRYIGTENPVFNCLRWFLPFIVKNLNLFHKERLITANEPCELFVFGWQPGMGYSPKRATFQSNRIIDLINYHIEHKNEPVVDYRLYDQLVQNFVHHYRFNFNTNVVAMLGRNKNMPNSYTQPMSDRISCSDSLNSSSFGHSDRGPIKPSLAFLASTTNTSTQIVGLQASNDTCQP
jgi:hypothetical protein